MTAEKEVRGASGWAMLGILLVVFFAGIYGIVRFAEARAGWPVAASAAAVALDCACFAGLTVVNPNQAKVLTLFGVYKGTIKTAGLWWVSPLTSRRRLSLRIRNFESSRLKVNDKDGNPIEIAAV